MDYREKRPSKRADAGSDSRRAPFPLWPSVIFTDPHNKSTRTKPTIGPNCDAVNFKPSENRWANSLRRNLAISWVWAGHLRYVNRRNYRCATAETVRDGYPNLGEGGNMWIIGEKPSKRADFLPRCSNWSYGGPLDPRWADLSTSEENPHAPNAFSPIIHRFSPSPRFG